MSTQVNNENKSANILQVLFSRKFLTLFVAYIAGCLAFSCTGSVFVKYGTDYLGLSAVAVGTVAGMVSMIGLIMRPISAVVVDQFNRKYMLILSYGLLALSSVILYATNSIGGLYAAQILRGVGWALHNCVGYIMVGDSVGKEKVGTAISIYSMAMIIAASFSAVMILAIANSFGYKTCFLATLGFGALATLLVMTLPSSKSLRLHEDKTLAESLKAIRLDNIISFRCLPIVVISFGLQLISVLLGASWIVKFADAELGIKNAGIFATISGVIMYFTKPAFGYVMDKLGCRWCVFSSCIGFAAACLIAANAPTMTILYISAAVYGVFCGGYQMAARAMAMKMMPADRQAVATSTVGIGNDIGMTVANIAIPAIMVATGSYRGVYSVFAAASAAILVYSVIYGRIYLKRHPENEMNW